MWRDIDGVMHETYMRSRNLRNGHFLSLFQTPKVLSYPPFQQAEATSGCRAQMETLFSTWWFVTPSCFWCCSVAKSCPALCNPMDCSTPGFPVHHQLLELTQIHVCRICDAVQPSHPLSSPSPPAFNLSQHQGLSQWVSSSHQVAKVLELQLQHHSLQWIFRTDFLNNFLVWSPCSPRESPESSPTPQFKSINSSALSFLWSNSHIYTWLQEKP